MRKLKYALTFLVLTFAFGVGLTPTIASAQPRADLEVMPWQAPSSPMANSPYQYRVTVRNVGNKKATGVKLVVDMPLTDTSPTRHILGKLTNFGSCQKVSNKLQCNLPDLNSNQSAFINFTFELPVSTKTLSFNATASMTGTPAETITNNNSRLHTPVIAHGTNQITDGDIVVSMCTGRGLSSYFECELFPGSIQSFDATLNGDGTIMMDNYQIGTWDQNISPKRLHMNLTDGSMFADFNGFSTGTNCFEGMTIFTPASPYSSPYKVCLQ